MGGYINWARALRGGQVEQLVYIYYINVGEICDLGSFH